MSFDFDTPVVRSGTSAIKWERYAGRGVIPLWVADMDFRSPTCVIEALRRRVDHGVFGYTGTPPELTETVLAMLEREYGWRVAAEALVWLPGLVTGLNVACRAVGADGDQVATFTPVYPPFLTAPRNSRREVVRIPLAETGGGWEIDFDLLERSLTPLTVLLLLCSPHNPVGRVWSEEELERLAEVAARRGMTICSDEIHAGLVLDTDRRHLPIAALSPETAARTITLHAPSKTWNIPGLGCSFAVIPDRGLRRAFTGAMAGIVPHVNLLGYTAALAAYREGEEWRQELLDYLWGNRDLVEREVGTMPGLAITHAEATYLSWIDARGLGIKDPHRFFEEAGVGLSDGAEFGGEGFLRLNFGTSRSILRKALERMRRAVPPR